jgi:hypothetical protein
MTATFLSTRFQRDQASKRKRTKSLPSRTGFLLEPLESRILLSADLFGVPIWDPQGPAPTTDGQASASPDDAVTGSVNAVAPHPTNPDILYIGATNGGIWKTTNATSDTPNWTPLTDQFPTLSIGDLAFSPLDATNNTLFAGTGGFDNGGFNGPAQGILRTTDGGATWQQFGQATFANDRIRSIVPTAIGTSLADQVVLVAAIDGNGGVYRSTDGGQNFTLISGTSGSSDGLDNDADGTIDEAFELNLPTGAASYLVGDPGNANRFYAAIPTKGIFRSDNGGANWIQVNNGLTGTQIGSGNIELSVSAADGQVYAGFVSGGVLGSVFSSTDLGGSWTVIGAAPAIHPGSQGFNNFSIVADPGNANIVFVGGDRQASSPFVGNLFRGDASSGSWDDITDTFGTLFTAPHADSRDMAFDANGNIIESDDGGVFRFSEGFLFDTWSSLNRNLQVAEFYSATYDHLENVIFGGTQDTGSPRQTGQDSLTWDEVNQGDGGTSGVGYFSFLGSDFSVEYTMGNNFGTFEAHFSGFPFTLFDGQLGLNGLDATDSAFTGFTTFPYDVNPFDGARLVIGGINSLYESTDFGDNLTNITPAGANGVSAIAYGGSAGGVPNPDVIYAGVGGNLFLRTTSGGAFTQLTNYTGGSPRDIVLDPDDWHGVYVTDGASVFHSTDGGNTWTTINAAGLTALTSSVNTIEVFSATTTPGDEVLLAGGTSGVFRTRNPSAGATALWSEFGAALPNTPVADIQYDATDDVLIASAYGRGVWKVADASTFLPVPGVLQVDGDTDFPGEDDIIKLVRNPNVTNILDVYLNNLVTPILSVPITSIEQINVNGLGGNDTLIVDSTNGLINVVNGIRYDGDGGVDDKLQLVQTNGPIWQTDTYSLGAANGSGKSVIFGSVAAGTQTVFFENLSPVLDLVPVGMLTVNATAADNAISYTGASDPAHGLITFDEHESIEFANKDLLIVNAGAGQDTISVNDSSTPDGLDSITVNGGGPSSGDTLVITGAGADVTVNTGLGTIDGATGAGGEVEISYGTIETLNLLAGIANLTITTTAADDTAVVTPGPAAGANSGSVQSSGAVPQIAFVNSGTFTANLGAGAGHDALIVNGSSLADTVLVSGTSVAIAGRRTVDYSGAEALTVNGNAGSDTFTVTPSAAVAMFIDGGDPIGVSSGDVISITTGGMVTFNAGPETDEGSIVVAGLQPVSFDHIERVAVTGNGGNSAVINGTDGPDAITVAATSELAGTNGVQDFIVSVNGGPQLVFIDVPQLVVFAQGGSDEVTLVTPATNNAVWDVDVMINGGPPAAASDHLVVQTPGLDPEIVVYTPFAPGGGTLDLVSLSSVVTINSIELLTYDGQSDNDSLTIVGTAGDDTIVHTPGATDQAGTLQVNGLLALNYQNLGSGGSLTADGGGGANTLKYFGTAGNDAFTIDGAGLVGGAGQVALNTRPVLHTANIQTLTLEGGDGDDTFTLLPAISSSVYSTMNFNGGGQASATGDRVNLIGTGGNDDIVISGQVVSLGGKTINSSGIEDIRLDADTGDDLITYNGVSGVSENILVSSSGVAGAGQISVPGVALINFSNVERIDVNGNPPTPTETDTLTFAGTNAADTFDINLSAVGTDADPILKLSNSIGTTLLTLRSYTFFDTLRVLGLDGTDTFNVTTAATGPSRNLFVDGGLPTGKKKSTDNLNIFYTPPRPSIIHSAATQDPDAGIVDLDYGTAQYVVQYDDIEQVVIRKV